MNSTADDNRPARVRYTLRRRDQTGVAVFAATALVVLGVRWGWFERSDGPQVEFNRVDPRDVRFEIDLNDAGWPELTLLPGIGETLARRIVESRAADGPFSNHDELVRVRGIGPKKLDAARPYLKTVNDPPGEAQ